MDPRPSGLWAIEPLLALRLRRAPSDEKASVAFGSSQDFLSEASGKRLKGRALLRERQGSYLDLPM